MSADKNRVFCKEYEERHGDVMLLGDRKLAILRTIIDDYIVTAEPIGSRSIAKKYELSSATIRNEMADLEEMGYLKQLHSSSGRVPSDKAYRFYVDKLMQVNALTSNEAAYIKDVYEKKSAQLEDLLMLTAKTLSDISNYTAIAIGPKIDNVVVKNIRLIPIDENYVLLIVVTDGGMMKDMIIRKPFDMDESYLDKVSEKLNYYFRDKHLNGIDSKVFDQVKDGIARDKDFFNSLVDTISETVDGTASRKVYTEGLNNILDIPEYNDIVKAKEFFSLMKKKQLMFDLVDSDEMSDGVNIHIGEENPIDEMKSFSVITATYCVNKKIYGSIGIIGPKRMNYPKVVSLIDSVVDELTQHLMALGESKENEKK